MKKLTFFCLLLVGCATQKIETPFWEKILNSIPWEQAGYIFEGTPYLPEDMFQILYENGYKFVNSTHKPDNVVEELGENAYVLDKNKASYDPLDDTFSFTGKLYPSEAPIWLIFSKDENYALYLGPIDENEKDFKHIRINGNQPQN
jgi:hypothetical protein